MGLLSRFKQKQEARNDDDGEFTPRSEEAQDLASGRKERTRRSRNQDPLLPEKKKARRRLIGAIALTLAAVIVLPMVFDAEPKQLADDIDVRIPAKDKVPEQAQLEAQNQTQIAKNNRATELREEIVDPASLKSAVAASDNKAALSNTPTPAKHVTANSVAATPSPATATLPKPEPKLELKPAKPESKTEPKNEKVSKPELKPEKHETRSEVKTVKANDKPVDKLVEKSTDKPQEKIIDKAVFDKPAKVSRDADAERALAILEGRTPAKPAAEKTTTSRYVIQVAALANQEKVDELRAKLQSANLKSYTQKVNSDGGEKIRVRLGPYSSKEEAEQAKAKLAKLGLSGSLVPN